MSLLEKASLVMIPSGYKEDVVYSQIPTNGDGDLTFTRASDATRVNSAGLVEVCPWNLVEYSEDFSNSFWTKQDSSITANTIIAPNGTTTADTFTRTINTGYIYNGSFSLAIGQYTQSVYAKANDSSSIRLEFVTSAFGRGAACIFDLSNGTAGTITIYGGVSGFTATIESVGNGWYRCSLGGTITIADTYFYELSITSGSVYIWGAQLNIGSTAKPYFPTTDRLNVPRLDYSGGSCPSLLLEKQSTNLALYSEQFDNAAWSNSISSVTANNTTSPDGTQNADLITFTSTLYASIYQAVTTTNGATYTASVYAKKGNQNFLGLEIRGASSSTDTVFNLNTGVVVSGTGTIESVGNGWYRCSITKAANSTSTLLIIGRGDSGANNDTVYLWGAQLEASSYPTSYIPTTSSSATRVADAAYKTGISSLIGQTEGTIFVDFVFNGYMESIEELGITADSSNRIGLYTFDGTATLRGYIVASGYVPFEANVISLTIGQRYKVAFAYKSGDCNIYVNGVTQLQNSNSFTIGSTLNAFRFNNLSGTSPFYKPINEAILFKTRLTNAELASLTTI